LGDKEQRRLGNKAIMFLEPGEGNLKQLKKRQHPLSPIHSGSWNFPGENLSLSEWMGFSFRFFRAI